MSTPQSADFTTQQKLDALLSALQTGAITQQQYDVQYAILTGTGPEAFSLVKFLEGCLSVLSPVNWAKDFAAIFNIRRLLIIGAIGLAFWFGLRDRIPVFNLGNNSLQGKSFTINLGNGTNLSLNKSGQLQVVDAKTGKVQKTIRVKDIPQLNAAIKPIGFQFKPIAVGGYGGGASGFGPEIGTGVSWFKMYKLETDSFVTTKGVYPLGISYKLDKFGSGNTSVGLAGGFGFKGDKRILAYVRIEF